jgi:diguanylate cyclase (GGDEF)-like protein
VDKAARQPMFRGMGLGDHRRTRAFSAAAILAGATFAGMVEAALPGGPQTSVLPGVVALALVPLVLVFGPRLDARYVAPLGPIGAVLIAWAIASTHGYADGAVLYAWPTLWMAHFYGRRGTVGIVACIALAHAGALILMPAGQGNIDRWIDVTVSVTVVGAVVCVLSERNAQLVRRLRTEARLDPLTGLTNRRGLQERTGIELARAARDHTSLAAVAFDIDHFKCVNDVHGHDAGDRVLAWLGTIIAEEARRGDVAARVGGEEFVVLLPRTRVVAAEAFAERVRIAVEEGRPEGLALTISAGVAAELAPADDAALLAAADAALYAAKRAGRNRTVVAAPVAELANAA